MSFGADSNAYTDFRHTVFTLNCCLDPVGSGAHALTERDRRHFERECADEVRQCRYENRGQ
eukprot:1185716-Prorocentrum_minimum.AAC.8